MDERCLKNPYPDYPGNEPHIITAEEGQLDPKFKEKILITNRQLLKYLEKKLKTEIDWNDYSVYTGTTGFSLLYLHLFSFDPKRDQSINLIEKALYYVEIVISSFKGKKLSFLCGDAGPIALAAVLYNKKGQQDKSLKLVKELSKLTPSVINLKEGVSDELLYGRAGFLYSLLFIRKHIQGQTYITLELIRSVIDSIIKSGKDTAQREGKRNPPLMYNWHEKVYIGAAHGIGGILYILLQCKDFLTQEELQNLIKPSIDFILTLRFKSGNYQSSLGSKTDRLVQWCHGASGLIHLFALAYQVFREEKYLKAALECSDVIWERGLLIKGYSLCHGAAGNGYSFLKLYQVTKDEKHLYRAARFAEWCLDYGRHKCRTPDRPWSLFEGIFLLPISTLEWYSKNDENLYDTNSRIVISKIT